MVAALVLCKERAMSSVYSVPGMISRRGSNSIDGGLVSEWLQ